jgi:vacuolar-type H+-ATPase subunit F/Vma7
MTEGRILVVGSADVVLGLSLLGIDGTAVGTAAEAAAALDEAMATPGVALVLLGEAWGEALHAHLERMALLDDGPLVVELPDPDRDAGQAAVTERVGRVLGSRLAG